MVNFAAVERDKLADTLTAVGADAPTLCEGWRTRDLALHLIERDSRPDILLGTMFRNIPFLGKHAAAGHSALERLEWEQIVDRVRHPHGLAPAKNKILDRAINTAEFFIHHEDIRRATAEWQPRQLPHMQEEQLWQWVKLSHKPLLRKQLSKTVLAAPEYGTVSGGGYRNMQSKVRVVSGTPSELLLWLFGRQGAADVTVSELP